MSTCVTCVVLIETGCQGRCVPTGLTPKGVFELFVPVEQSHYLVGG